MSVSIKRFFSLIFAVVFVFSQPLAVTAEGLNGDIYTEAAISTNADASDDFEVAEVSNDDVATEPTTSIDENGSYNSEIKEIEDEHISGEVLVVYEDNTTIRQENTVKNEYDLAEETGDDSLVENTGENGFDTVHKLEITDDTSVEEMIAQLENDPRVKYVEPNYIIETNSSITLNDLHANQQWHLDKINAHKAWEALGDGGAEIKVAVIDTQTQLDHPDLAENLVDASNMESLDGSAWAGEEHGTHVSGIIAAVANNGKGVAGVTYNKVKVIPITAGAGRNISSEGMIKGYQYAVNANARVVNMSFGSTGSYNIFRDALRHGKKMGVVNVAGAGNDGLEVSRYPADYDSVISVISTTSTDVKASSSTYGDGKNISAPGEDIMSTGENSTYKKLSGTSMASPVVAGGAALILSANPDLTPTEVEAILYKTAEDLGEEGYDSRFGNGRIDAERAVNYALYGETSVTSISFDETDIGLDIGETRGLRPNILPANATNTNKGKWESDDTDIAVVDSKGTITAKKPGNATITLTYGNVSASVNVAVVSSIKEPAWVSASVYNYHTFRVTFASVLGADGYEVFRYVSSGGGEGVDSNYNSIGTTTTTSYSDDTINEPSLWTNYKVKAFVVVDGERLYSPFSTAGYTWGGGGVPAPTNFDAITSGSDIKLSWDKVSGATSYTIEYSTDNSPFSKLITINDGNTLSYIHESLEEDVTHFYRIYASRAKISHTLSNVITCVVDGSLPKITGAKIAATDYQTVNMSWDEVIGADGYEIERRKNPGGGSEYEQLTSTITSSYADVGLIAGYTYFYKIRAFKTVGEEKEYGDYSAIINASPRFDNAPQNVKVESLSTSSVKLTWDAVEGATEYIIERGRLIDFGGTINMGYSYLAPVDGLEYVDTGLSSSTNYRYRVSTGSTVLYNDWGSGYSSAVNGAFSDSVSIIPHAVYPNLENIMLTPMSLNVGSYKQMNITATPANAQVIGATWSSSDEAVATVNQDGIITGIAVGSTTISCDVDGRDATATVIVSEPAIRTPQNVTAKSNGFSSVKISWDAVNGADSYQVYRNSSASGNGSYIGTVSSESLELKYTVAYDTNHYYMVRSYSGSTPSDNSVWVQCQVDGAAPENIKTKVSYDTIDLSWDEVQGASGYTVMRSTNAITGFKSVGTVTDKGYKDDKTVLTEGAIYYYKIKAYAPGSIMGSSYNNNVKIYGRLSEAVSVQAIAVAKPTDKPTPTLKPTDKPTPTPKPTDKPNLTPKPTNKPSSTPKPTNKPVLTSKPPLPVAVKSIKTLPRIYVVEGKSVNLPATVQPYNAANKKYTWKSANKKIATVNSKGKVTVRKNTAGKKVKMTLTSKDGNKKAVCTVYVVKKKATLKSMKIKQSAGMVLLEKQTAQIKVTLNPKKVTGVVPKFTSSNKKIATVDKMGFVTAHKAGTTKITVKAGKIKKTIKVTVK